MLPEVKDSAAEFGDDRAVAVRRRDRDPRRRRRPAGGDASARPASSPGMVKSTYGTGCFAVLNTGDERRRLEEQAAHHHRLPARRPHHLRAGRLDLHRRRGRAMAARRAEADRARRPDRARSPPRPIPRRRSILVPAFTGLGAPHWDAEARGALFGLTRATGPRELARAALEAVVLPDARPDRGDAARLAGGGGRNGAPRRRRHGGERLDHAAPRRHPRRAGRPPGILETTALGAAWLAGRTAGVWPDMDGFAKSWQRDRRFEPAMHGGGSAASSSKPGSRP